MKSLQLLRRKNRIIKTIDLFSYSFTKNHKLKNPIFEFINEIDAKIEKAAPKYPIQKINKVDLAILRLAIYELVIERKEPPKAIINEAIEIAKLYGNEKSPYFINAVLARIYENSKSK